MKTYEEINKKIENNEAVVLTAEEMIQFVESNGLEVAAKEVDVVTSGTFGAMCSSGAFINFGHSDPPIKMEHLWLMMSMLSRNIASCPIENEMAGPEISNMAAGML